MKIFFCMVFSVVILIFSVGNFPSFVSIVDAPKNADYVFVMSDIKNISKFDLKCVVNGNYFIVSCNKNTAEKFSIDDATVVGQAVSYEADIKSIDDVISKLKLSIIKKESVNQIICVYGFTNYINNFVMVDGFKVNIQIAYSYNKIKIGTPIILDSY